MVSNLPKVIELKENRKTTFIEHLQDGRHFGVFFFSWLSLSWKFVELLWFFLFYRQITSEQYNDLLMHDSSGT